MESSGASRSGGAFTSGGASEPGEARESGRASESAGPATSGETREPGIASESVGGSRSGGTADSGRDSRSGGTSTPGGASESGQAPESGRASRPGDHVSAAAPASAAEPVSAAAPASASAPASPSDPAGASDPDDVADPDGAVDPVSAPDAAGRPRRTTRRFPLFTRDTARPEGGGRAASGGAPAPARQWPILLVLSVVGVGLLITALDVFRYGTLLIGAALLGGAVLRWVVPDVGMLAVRSRFTDMVTYTVLGTAIVLLSMMAQPDPWLEIPFLNDTLHYTIRSDAG